MSDHQDAVQSRAMTAARMSIDEWELEHKCRLSQHERALFLYAFRDGMIHGVSAARLGTEET
jgi:hypothetical protein